MCLYIASHIVYESSAIVAVLFTISIIVHTFVASCLFFVVVVVAHNAISNMFLRPNFRMCSPDGGEKYDRNRAFDASVWSAFSQVTSN